jgi:hypothetical protein
VAEVGFERAVKKFPRSCQNEKFVLIGNQDWFLIAGDDIVFKEPEMKMNLLNFQ